MKGYILLYVLIILCICIEKSQNKNIYNITNCLDEAVNGCTACDDALQEINECIDIDDSCIYFRNEIARINDLEGIELEFRQIVAYKYCVSRCADDASSDELKTIIAQNLDCFSGIGRLQLQTQLLVIIGVFCFIFML
ncbi:hypothetical protein PPERSA_08758 [Pseudocohnilembus persalinus]|uniref:Saposin B-type domain-containing protein n=1 Tax=Pseudocohnilembus persalinus TaxID=266149 RepID=A0A0V0R8C3_PSEPJ|nr:hypothetical protein PPERSA_08758 [Pseudocohnilembus persalinus]|eukprot:KRX10456.1 hypothetical protein PPERSA_08758 [Pseudocohnilembus persalinus]